MKDNIKEGIELCEDKCSCGGNLRLHTHVFGKNTKAKQVKYYIDCDKHCGKVSSWHNSTDEAIAEFDN